jgi:hypothetical protein
MTIGGLLQSRYTFSHTRDADQDEYGFSIPAPADDDPQQRGGMFQTVTAGVNYYLIPESNALKISADVEYFFDSEADSLVQPSARTSVRAGDRDGQYALRVQLSSMF